MGGNGVEGEMGGIIGGGEHSENDGWWGIRGKMSIAHYHKGKKGK